MDLDCYDVEYLEEVKGTNQIQKKGNDPRAKFKTPQKKTSNNAKTHPSSELFKVQAESDILNKYKETIFRDMEHIQDTICAELNKDKGKAP
jgi:hypothetical protein